MVKGKVWGKVSVRQVLLDDIKRNVGPGKRITNTCQFVDLVIREKLDKLEVHKK